MPTVGEAPWQYNTTIEVDISEIERALDKLDEVSSNVFRRIGARVEDKAVEIMKIVFEVALDHVDKNQFPDFSRNLLLAHIELLDYTPDVTAEHCIVEINFDDLGTRDDLTKAFHRRAQYAGGGRVEDGESWEGGDSTAGLKNPTELRYDFVLAMMEGTDWDDPRVGPDGVKRLSGKSGSIPTAGLWEQTLVERQNIWGDKSPFWLYLEFGQQDWDPTIEPFGVTEVFKEIFFPAANEIYLEEWEKAMAIINKYEQEGSKKDPEGGAKGRYRQPAGAEGGTGGQFRPKP